MTEPKKSKNYTFLFVVSLSALIAFGWLFIGSLAVLPVLNQIGFGQGGRASASVVLGYVIFVLTLALFVLQISNFVGITLAKEGRSEAVKRVMLLQRFLLLTKAAFLLSVIIIIITVVNHFIAFTPIGGMIIQGVTAFNRTLTLYFAAVGVLIPTVIKAKNYLADINGSTKDQEE